MKLTKKHIDYIENNLIMYGIKSKELKEDLLDHICSYIEEQDSQDFESLYQEALQKFGGYTSFQNLERETNFQKFAGQRIRLKRVLNIAGALTAVLMITGILFKIMHWPFANILLFTGFIVLIVLLTPVYFYDKYKSSTHKFSN